MFSLALEGCAVGGVIVFKQCGEYIRTIGIVRTNAIAPEIAALPIAHRFVQIISHPSVIIGALILSLLLRSAR